MEMIKYLDLIQTFLKTDIQFIEKNGKKVVVENGVVNTKLPAGTEEIVIEPQFVGAHGSIDKNISSILERETMKNNGVLLISYLVKDGKVMKANYDPIGIVNIDGKTQNRIAELGNEITNRANDFIQKDMKDGKEIKDFKKYIQRCAAEKYSKSFNKVPTVLVSFIENK
jgi:mRNA degradation ribonuclease J1/J2